MSTINLHLKTNYGRLEDRQAINDATVAKMVEKLRQDFRDADIVKVLGRADGHTEDWFCKFIISKYGDKLNECGIHINMDTKTYSGCDPDARLAIHMLTYTAHQINMEQNAMYDATFVELPGRDEGPYLMAGPDAYAVIPQHNDIADEIPETLPDEMAEKGFTQEQWTAMRDRIQHCFDPCAGRGAPPLARPQAAPVVAAPEPAPPVSVGTPVDADACTDGECSEPVPPTAVPQAEAPLQTTVPTVVPQVEPVVAAPEPAPPVSVGTPVNADACTDGECSEPVPPTAVPQAEAPLQTTVPTVVLDTSRARSLEDLCGFFRDFENTMESTFEDTFFVTFGVHAAVRNPGSLADPEADIIVDVLVHPLAESALRLTREEVRDLTLARLQEQGYSPDQLARVAMNFHSVELEEQDGHLVPNVLGPAFGGETAAEAEESIAAPGEAGVSGGPKKGEVASTGATASDRSGGVAVRIDGFRVIMDGNVLEESDASISLDQLIDRFSFSPAEMARLQEALRAVVAESDIDVDSGESIEITLRGLTVEVDGPSETVTASAESVEVQPLVSAAETDSFWAQPWGDMVDRLAKRGVLGTEGVEERSSALSEDAALHDLVIRRREGGRAAVAEALIADLRLDPANPVHQFLVGMDAPGTPEALLAGDTADFNAFAEAVRFLGGGAIDTLVDETLSDRSSRGALRAVQSSSRLLDTIFGEGSSEAFIRGQLKRDLSDVAWRRWTSAPEDLAVQHQLFYDETHGQSEEEFREQWSADFNENVRKWLETRFQGQVARKHPRWTEAQIEARVQRKLDNNLDNWVRRASNRAWQQELALRDLLNTVCERSDAFSKLDISPEASERIRDYIARGGDVSALTEAGIEAFSSADPDALLPAVQRINQVELMYGMLRREHLMEETESLLPQLVQAAPTVNVLAPGVFAQEMGASGDNLFTVFAMEEVSDEEVEAILAANRISLPEGEAPVRIYKSDDGSYTDADGTPLEDYLSMALHPQSEVGGEDLSDIELDTESGAEGEIEAAALESSDSTEGNKIPTAAELSAHVGGRIQA